MVKTPQKKLGDKADTLMSLIVRSAGQCVECGATAKLQNAHGFSRRYWPTRWDLRNGFCLCSGCHVFYTHRPEEWTDWLKDRWGVELYDEIRAKAMSNVKPDRALIVVGLTELWEQTKATL